RNDLKCDVLKVPHHGSKSSSSEEFLAQTRPRLAVVTVGKSNPYRHPADEVIERYERTGADICRTDRDGAVMIRLNEDRLEVTRWSEMMLERVPISDTSRWRNRELRNMRRLWIRTWEI
ncbi:MAG TPA: hypothetical protein VLG39_01465, partial [Nitrospirota bacterium]|nr:hypothetical protein [Nitrospirota bacterium]